MSLLRLILGLLLLAWVVSLALNVGGWLIHLILIVVLLGIAYDWLTGRRPPL
jgi:uncharacterized membrane protein YedE/YeeE